MAELKREGLQLQAERAVLVQVASYRERYEADETFRELESLSDTAGAVVVGRMRQKLARPHHKFYVGKGKLDELRGLCAQAEPDVVICDDELTAAQVKTLEAALDCKVVDRSEVILDIFAAHARTKQAKLQVELAQLEYEFPRLKRMWTHLDRTAGGTLGGPAGGGIGVRGPGEKQLEVDRRLVQRRIYDLKKDLAQIRRRRHTTAEGRHERFPTVALVGYTNAGKSSLMNRLTGAEVSVRDRLFETLDTRTRRWELSDGSEVLLSDTVGFIRKFPHHLAESFHATLEEAAEADLLLHVVDASKEESEQEVAAVNEVLEDIGALATPTIYVLNKMDVASDPGEAILIGRLEGTVVSTSAKTGAGLAELDSCVRAALGEGRRDVRVRIDPGNGRLISFLHDHGLVREQSSDDGVLEYTIRIDPSSEGLIRSMGGELLVGE
jgi:GTP-binding protein HflX